MTCNSCGRSLLTPPGSARQTDVACLNVSFTSPSRAVQRRIRTHVRPGEREKEHVAQSCKWYGAMSITARRSYGLAPWFRSQQLAVSHEACNKRRRGYCQQDISEEKVTNRISGIISRRTRKKMAPRMTRIVMEVAALPGKVTHRGP